MDFDKIKLNNVTLTIGDEVDINIVDDDTTFSFQGILSNFTAALLVENGYAEPVNDTEVKPVYSRKLVKKLKRMKAEKNYKTLLRMVINKLIRQTGWKASKVLEVLYTLEKVNKGAVTSLYLRTMAVILEQQYEDNIEDVDLIYFISQYDFEIHHMPNANLNFKHIAAFRTQEDAEYAHECYKAIEDSDEICYELNEKGFLVNLTLE